MLFIDIYYIRVSVERTTIEAIKAEETGIV